MLSDHVANERGQILFAAAQTDLRKEISGQMDHQAPVVTLHLVLRSKWGAGEGLEWNSEAISADSQAQWSLGLCHGLPG